MADWNAADYSKNSANQQQWALALIERLALRGDERVLDIGCGDGKVTAELASRVPRGKVIGVDSSGEMIAFARGAFPPATHANLSFEQGDATHLDFESTFDVVFSNAALHWVLDHAAVLAGIALALKEGGRILLQMGGRGNAADVIAAHERVRIRDVWRKYFADFDFRYGFYAPEDYSGWLANSGLAAQRVELVVKQMVHLNRAAFTGWLRTAWMPFLDPVPANRRVEFLDAWIDAYLEPRPERADRSIEVRMVRLEVEAAKPMRGVASQAPLRNT